MYAGPKFQVPLNQGLNEVGLNGAGYQIYPLAKQIGPGLLGGEPSFFPARGVGR